MNTPETNPELLSREADLGYHRAIERAKEAAARLSDAQAALMYQRLAGAASEYALVHSTNARKEPTETRPAPQAGVERRAP